MLKIGEFARLSQVSMKTLRHYDALGVLRPSQIDLETGYRLYDLAQLGDMMRIQALKDCGFALEEIAQLLQTHDVKAIEALLKERVAAQEEVISNEQARLQRLMARLNLLTNAEYIPHHDVVLKQTEPLTLVGVRQCIGSREEIGQMAEVVLQRLEQQSLIPIGPSVHVYYDVEAESIDLFIGAAVMALPTTTPNLICERLAGGEQVACVLHRSEYAAIQNAYVALHMWLATSGYRISGPCREIYHRSPRDTRDSDAYLTEIQLPIA